MKEKEAYIKFKEYYENYDKFCIIHTPGTGRENIIIEYIKELLENKTKVNILYFILKNSNKGKIIDTINTLKIDKKTRQSILKSISFITYDKLEKKEIENLDKYNFCVLDNLDYLDSKLILDKLKKIYNSIKTIGIYSFENKTIKTIFNDKVVYKYDIVDALNSEILKLPNYYICLESELSNTTKLKQEANNNIDDEILKEKFNNLYNEFENKAKEFSNVLQKHLNIKGKYIFLNIKLQDIKSKLSSKYLENAEFYEIKSSYSDKKNNKTFYNFCNDIKEKDESTKSKLRILISDDIYVEDTSIKELDGIVISKNSNINELSLAMSIKSNKEVSIIDLSSNLDKLFDILNRLDNKNIIPNSIKSIMEILELSKNITNEYNKILDEYNNKKKEEQDKELQLSIEPIEKENKKAKTSLNILIKIIIFISIIGIGYSIVNIIVWKIDKDKLKNQINEVVDTTDVIEKEDTENTEILNNENVDEFNPYWDYIKMNLIDVDFTELKQKNSETVGWVQLNGTNINFPFVQTVDNDFYLHHSFDKNLNQAGWIFMDYRNNIQNFDTNTIIYGHSLTGGTMFGTLKNILNYDWQSNTNNHIVKLSTEYENTLWQVFSIYRIPTTSDYLQINFVSDLEYMEFLDMIKNRSEYNFNTNVSSTDKILTLSSCYLSSSNKVVLHAKLIKKESK